MALPALSLPFWLLMQVEVFGSLLSINPHILILFLFSLKISGG